MLLGVLIATPASAQRLRGGAMGYLVQRRVSYQGTVDEQTGTWIGVEGGVRLGPVTVGASGLFGSLAGAADPLTTPDLSVRVSNLSVGFRATPWIDLAGVAEARRYESDAGISVWVLMGPQVRLTPPLGVAGLAASAEISYFASASVKPSTEKLSPAMRASVGAEFSPRTSPILFRVSYRFERFDFGASGTSPARLEQFSGVVAGIGVGLGRR